MKNIKNENNRTNMRTIMNLIHHYALIYTVLLNSLLNSQFDYIDKKTLQMCVCLNKLKIIVFFIGGLDNASIAIIR